MGAENCHGHVDLDEEVNRGLSLADKVHQFGWQIVDKRIKSVRSKLANAKFNYTRDLERILAGIRECNAANRSDHLAEELNSLESEVLQLIAESKNV